MENEKSCDNCRYFVQYYIKHRLGYYKTLHGHCSENLTRKNPVLCVKWEDMAIKIEKEKRSVKEALINMSERLDEIALILKDEE